MAKISLTDLVNLENQTTAVNNINANNATLEAAFENTLSRDGHIPNTMGSNLDMNSNQILNLPSPASATSPARLMDVVSPATIAQVPPVGTSGAKVPLLNANNTWSGTQTYSTGIVASGTGQFYSDSGASITRIQDRLFLGEAADKFAGTSWPDTGTSWLSLEANGPAFLANHATFLATNEIDGYSIVGAARGSGCIGVAGACEVTSGGGWAFYADYQIMPGGDSCSGIEIASKNASGTNPRMAPHSQTTGAFGVWLAGGGDNAYGPLSTDPSTAAVVVLKNSQSWNTGLIFMEDSLTDGEAISLSSVGVGGAHFIAWYDASSNQRATISCDATSQTWNQIFGDGGVTLNRSGGLAALTVASATSAVNGITVFANSAGNNPSVNATGSDTDIDLGLAGKGAGLVRFGTYVNTPGAITGYVIIKDSSGTERKVGITS